jgi:arsenate reductase
MSPPRVLFVCVENSCRSQLAEALGTRLGLCASSAGSRPSGRVHPLAVSTMAELDYDLATHRSTSIHELRGQAFDAVVTMGCGDDCPEVPTDLREDWPIPDPRDGGPEEFRRVRELLVRNILELARRLASPRTPPRIPPRTLGA